MSGSYPWEERPPEPAAGNPAQPPEAPPAQMELEAPAGGEGTTSPAPVPPAQPAAQPAAGPVSETPLRPAARERPVARKEYYSIGEVSELAGLPAHVLRYWESQFPVLNPSKNRSGNRAYQRKEIKLILLVKHLLYEEKYTVEGAKAKLDQLRRGGQLADHTARALDTQTLALLREDVARLRKLLAG